MFIWVALKENARLARILWIITKFCSKQGFLLVQWKNTRNLMPKRYLRGPVTWKVTWKDIANWRIQRLTDYTKSQRHAWMTTNVKEEEIGSLGELSTVCSQIVVKCLYLARIGRPDILWSVNKLARAVTKLTTPCDKRLARLVSYILHQTKKQNQR